MYMKPTIAKLFDIQYKEVADVAQQIEKLAQKLSQAASQEDSPNDNDIYGYSTDIVELVRTITPVMEENTNGSFLSESPRFLKIKNTVRRRGL